MKGKDFQFFLKQSPIKMVRNYIRKNNKQRPMMSSEMENLIEAEKYIKMGNQSGLHLLNTM